MNNLFYLLLLILLYQPKQLNAQATEINNNYSNNRYLGYNGTNGANPLLFKTNGMTHMQMNGLVSAYGLSTAGFIGIGTSNPAAPLHIEGKGIQNQQGWLRGLTLSNRAAIMWDGGTGKGFFMAHPSSNPNGNFYAGIADNLNSNSAVNYTFSVHVNQPIGSNPVGTMQFFKNVLVFDPLNERRMGVNTSVPQRALEISDAGNSPADAQLRLTSTVNAFTDIRTSPTGVCYLTPSSGRTVVAAMGSTVTPSATLDVAGDLRIRKTLEESGTSLLVGRPNGSNTDLSVRRLDFTGNSNDVLLGNGTWGPAPTPGVSFAENGASISQTNAIEWGGSPLLHDTEIPLNGFNVFFTDPQTSNSSTNKLKIGGNTFPLPSKLSVVNVQEPNGLIVRSITSTTFPGTKTGIHAESVQAQFPIGVSVKSSTGEQVLGVKAAAYNGSIFTIGVNGQASAGSIGEVYGGRFSAASPTIGSNRGVVGSAAGSPKTNIGGFFSGNGGTTSIGVYGEATSAQQGAVNWAGYFAGPVQTNGTYITSDSQFKTNVQPLNPMTDILNALNPVSYTYLQSGNAAQMNFENTAQIGFIAQEVQQFLPQLVRSTIHPEKIDSAGNVMYPSFNYESMNYTGLIPIMIKGFQEQHQRINQVIEQNSQLAAQVQNLQNQLIDLAACLTEEFPGFCATNSGMVNHTENGREKDCWLSCSPNPFNEQTVIKLYLQEKSRNGQLKLINMEGKTVKEIDIVDRGEIEILVTRNNLTKGKYICVLYADGIPAAQQTIVID